MSQVTLGGNPIDVAGTFPSAGQQRPISRWSARISAISSSPNFAGKRKVLNIVPSLDTPTCATSTRKFNEAAAKLDQHGGGRGVGRPAVRGARASARRKASKTS